MQGVQVWSLVRELRCHMSHGQYIHIEGEVLCQILGSSLKNLDASLPESCDTIFGSPEPLCLTSDFPEAFMWRGHDQAFNQQFQMNIAFHSSLLNHQSQIRDLDSPDQPVLQLINPELYPLTPHRAQKPHSWASLESLTHIIMRCNKMVLFDGS